MTAELLRLAERCEKETAGSRELDRDIAIVLGLPWDYGAEWRGWGLDEHGVPIEKPAARPYTTSLDAAMSLVPEGLGWIIGNGRVRQGEPLGGAQITTLDGNIVIAEAEACTPALALTAAALRALASRDD